MKVYLFAHVPKQEGLGRLAQRSSGLVAQATIVAKDDSEAREKFKEQYPERHYTSYEEVANAVV